MEWLDGHFGESVCMCVYGWRGYFHNDNTPTQPISLLLTFHNPPQLATTAIAILEEAAALRPALQHSIAQKLPQHAAAALGTASEARRSQYYQRMRALFLRCLGCDAGVAFLDGGGWLGRLAQEWTFGGGGRCGEGEGDGNDAAALGHYARAVERRLMQATFAMANQGEPPYIPAAPPTAAVAAAAAADAGGLLPRPRPTPIVIKGPGLLVDSALAPAQDARALLSLPWRIEVIE
jgi:hypothetical protein